METSVSYKGRTFKGTSSGCLTDCSESELKTVSKHFNTFQYSCCETDYCNEKIIITTTEKIISNSKSNSIGINPSKTILVLVILLQIIKYVVI